MANQNGDRRVEPGFSRNRPHANLTMLRFAVFAVFAVLALRLVDMQILNGKEYAERSTNNHIAEERIVPTRGLIYDRDGEPLVRNVGTFTATVTPAFLPDTSNGSDARYRVFLELEAITGVPALEIQSRVAEAVEIGAHEMAIPIARNMSHEAALMLSEAAPHLPGVELVVTPSRSYIAGDVFSHILGYIGPQSEEDWTTLAGQGYAFNEMIGRSGIEASYQAVLRGTPGIRTTEVNADGAVLATLGERAPQEGASLRLAIDKDLQQFMAERLQDEIDSGEASVGAAVAMNPNTGEILGIVSLPAYDNNIFGDLGRRGNEYESLIADPRNPLLNHALSPVAPGSTFKLITAAAGLQEGTITPASNMDVTSRTLEIVGEDGIVYPFRDWAAHGYVDLRRAIAVSSNHFFYMASCGLIDRGVPGLGSDLVQSAVILGHYAHEFGLGQRTGIDLVGGEAAGIVPSPEWKRRAKSDPELFNPEDREWYYADTCFMGIGQGDVTATPLQIAMMGSAVANGGYLVTPRVVASIIHPDGTEQHLTAERERIAVDDAHLQVIREGMLQSVAEEDGAARQAAVPGVRVAGKTGTAEYTRPGSNVLLNHAWFTGFAPYDDPEIVVAVFLDIGWGGSVAAPIGGDIIEFYMEHVAR